MTTARPTTSHSTPPPLRLPNRVFVTLFLIAALLTYGIVDAIERQLS
jgi:hypothetical protein